MARRPAGTKAWSITRKSSRALPLYSSFLAPMKTSPSWMRATPILIPIGYAQVSNNVSKAEQPTGFADIVERVKSSVIAVSVTKSARREGFDDGFPFSPGSPLERFFGSEAVTGLGSGFFISADGYAVTNNHVVDTADKVEITTDDGRTYAAKVIGTDAPTDLALIKVEGNLNFPFAELADDKPRIGDWVLAVGNPFGLGGTVTAGIVSAVGRDIGNGPYDDFIQIDAAVNKGNSGGPAFNIRGEVIGVNSAIYSPSGGSVGIAFSIPSSTVRWVVTQLKNKGRVHRGWIGVTVQSITAEVADSLGLQKAEGAIVAEPQVDGPAANSGIKAGDVIIAVNDQPIRNSRELARIIAALAPGTSARLKLLHQGQEKTVDVTLDQLPDSRETGANTEHGDNSRARRITELSQLGLTLAPVSSMAGAGRAGVVVTAVDPTGPAADHGFKEGDVILDVAGKKVSTPDDIGTVLRTARAENKTSVLFKVRSGGTTSFIAMSIAKGW